MYGRQIIYDPNNGILEVTSKEATKILQDVVPMQMVDTYEGPSFKLAQDIIDIHCPDRNTKLDMQKLENNIKNSIVDMFQSIGVEVENKTRRPRSIQTIIYSTTMSPPSTEIVQTRTDLANIKTSNENSVDSKLLFKPEQANEIHKSFT